MTDGFNPFYRVGVIRWIVLFADSLMHRKEEDYLPIASEEKFLPADFAISYEFPIITVN